MSLILDHINGIHDDNRIENLRIVCPNCEGTLPTHCRNINREKLKTNRKLSSNDRILSIKNHSIKLRKTERPPYEQLQEQVKHLGYRATSRKYNVSDHAIRKWIEFYEKYEGYASLAN